MVWNKTNNFKHQAMIFIAQLFQSVVTAWMDFIIHEPNIFFFGSSWEQFCLTFRMEVWGLPFLELIRLLINFGSAGQLVGVNSHFATVEWKAYPWGEQWARKLFSLVNFFRLKLLPVTGLALLLPYSVSWFLLALPGQISSTLLLCTLLHVFSACCRLCGGPSTVCRAQDLAPSMCEFLLWTLVLICGSIDLGDIPFRC